MIITLEPLFGQHGPGRCYDADTEAGEEEAVLTDCCHRWHEGRVEVTRSKSVVVSMLNQQDQEGVGLSGRISAQIVERQCCNEGRINGGE